MYAKLVTFFAFLGVATCLTTYPLCTDVPSTGTLNDANIEGCTPDQTCILHPKDVKPVTVDFTPSAGSNNLSVGLFAQIGGVWIPFSGFDTRGCLPERNINCPLVANTKYEYQNQITVPAQAPAIPTFPVKFQLVGDASSTIVCFLVQVTIQN